MSMLNERLRDAWDYVQFPVTLSVASVHGLEIMQKAIEYFEMPQAHGPVTQNGCAGVLAGILGVAVSNVRMQNHNVGTCLPAMIATLPAAYAASLATKNMADAAYLTAFATAMAGMVLRHKWNLDPDTTEKKPDPRSGYDDLEP